MIRALYAKIPTGARLALFPCAVAKRSCAHNISRVMHAASVVQRTLGPQDPDLGNAIAEFLANMRTLWSSVRDPPLPMLMPCSDYQFPQPPRMFRVHNAEGSGDDDGDDDGDVEGSGDDDGDVEGSGDDDGDVEGSDDDDGDVEGSDDDDGDVEGSDDSNSDDSNSDGSNSDGSNSDGFGFGFGFGKRTALDHLVICIREWCNTMPGFRARRMAKLRAAKAANDAVKHVEPARDNHRRFKRKPEAEAVPAMTSVCAAGAVPAMGGVCAARAVPAKVLVAESDGDNDEDDDTAAVRTAKQIRHVIEGTHSRRSGDDNHQWTPQTMAKASVFAASTHAAPEASARAVAGAVAGAVPAKVLVAESDGDDEDYDKAYDKDYDEDYDDVPTAQLLAQEIGGNATAACAAAAPHKRKSAPVGGGALKACKRIHEVEQAEAPCGAARVAPCGAARVAWSAARVAAEQAEEAEEAEEAEYYRNEPAQRRDY